MNHKSGGGLPPRRSPTGCYNCGEPGHSKADCPEPRKQTGACYNCGEEGHSKADCPEPRKQTGACFNCGDTGHSKADCPEPRKQTGACYNCGEEGHNKVNCPKPRVFKGTCRICSQEGHPAVDCPEKPADICRNCKAEGHQTKVCQANRKFDLNHVADKLPEEAWDLMKAASDEKEIGSFREALQIYSKSCPEETFESIGKKMRDENFNIHLIALTKPPEDVISLIDLQGQLDREFVVGFFFSDKAQRANLRERWPTSTEENIERLQNAGLPYDRQIMKCRNCGELGHSARGCKQERATIERTEIKCTNCGELGHRMRDCKASRKSRFGCRNCGSERHEAKECPNPRSAENVECRRCKEKGHFAKDCPIAAPREPRTCRNCGYGYDTNKETRQNRGSLSKNHAAPPNISYETVTILQTPLIWSVATAMSVRGHAARACPQPKNWAKVKCNRCGQMGHTVKRCTEPEDGQGSENHTNRPDDKQVARRSVRREDIQVTKRPVQDEDMQIVGRSAYPDTPTYADADVDAGGGSYVEADDYAEHDRLADDRNW
ncbi:hypothetical protein VI817_005350 [Penicillium citrinum]|nr:hypothetical protein VI817_005350 [Penicillium citrinum]